MQFGIYVQINTKPIQSNGLLGGVKNFFKKKSVEDAKELVHMDLFWSSDAGLHRTCTQPEYIQSQAISWTDGKPVFNDEFSAKIKKLRDDFESKPVDISKENFDWEAFFIAFSDCMNWGYVAEDDEEYVSDITKDKVKNLYDNGLNLHECLRNFIVKSQDYI